MAFVVPESRRDRRIYDTDIKRAFDQTRRYDMVIVAATDDDEPSLRFFAGLVDHIVLVARAGGREQNAFEQIIARAGLDTKKIRGAVLTGAATACTTLAECIFATVFQGFAFGNMGTAETAAEG